MGCCDLHNMWCIIGRLTIESLCILHGLSYVPILYIYQTRESLAESIRQELLLGHFDPHGGLHTQTCMRHHISFMYTHTPKLYYAFIYAQTCTLSTHLTNYTHYTHYSIYIMVIAFVSCNIQKKETRIRNVRRQTCNCACTKKNDALHTHISISFPPVTGIMRDYYSQLTSNLTASSVLQPAYYLYGSSSLRITRLGAAADKICFVLVDHQFFLVSRITRQRGCLVDRSLPSRSYYYSTSSTKISCPFNYYLI